MVATLAAEEEEDGSGECRWRGRGTRWTAGEGEEHSEALTLSVPRELRPILPPSASRPSVPSRAWSGLGTACDL